MTKNLLKFVTVMLLSLLIVLPGCKDDDPKSTLAGILKFSFEATDDIPGLENVVFEIDQETGVITNDAELPYATDVSQLIAKFEQTKAAIVTISNVEQVSGTTVNDYTSPVNYMVTAEDGVTTKAYQVVVNISQVNPEGVSWVKSQAAITDFAYQTVSAVYFNGKHRAIFGATTSNSAVARYYTSEDGVTWNLCDFAKTNLEQGSDYTMIVHDNKLYVCNYVSLVENWGWMQAVGLKKVYVSEDGETFNELENTYDMSRNLIRSSLFSFDNKLWVVGGNALAMSYEVGGDNHKLPSALSRNIWTTADGSTWEIDEENRILPEGAETRYSATVVHNGKMFMIGGQIKDYDGNDMVNWVWSSADGVTWEKTESEGLTPRMKAKAISMIINCG